MIKLREAFQTKQLEGQDRLAMYRPQVTVDCERTGFDRPTIDRTFGYRMKAVVWIDFWANQAQYSSAYQNAEKLMLARIYAEVLSDLKLLRSTIYGGDVSAAMQVIDKLEKELMTP
jgi:hypothetical protein